MVNITAVVVAAILAATTPITREVAVTFDDLPAVPASIPLERQRTLTRDLLRSIKTYNVPAIGFVNEGKLGGEPAKAKLLEQWLDAGYELGNHTFSHPDLHRIDVAEYERDIEKGERVIRPLLQKRGRELRWFRHPFLHTGTSLDTKRRIETFLSKRGVRVAPVTLDNSEWIFARAYENAIAKGDVKLKDRLGREYIAYMDRKLAYFEQQSLALFGRNIRHTLLVHANALNADWFDELAESMRKRGYTFISIDRALADPAYASADTYTGPAGLTWIHRWALTQKKPREFFAGEPTTAKWVLDAAGMDSE
jgi:peptidoglycan/xylan/chitin deacetylase (PgdA/CDA1 family)